MEGGEFINTDPRIHDPIFRDRQLFDLEWLRNGESRPSTGGSEPLVPVTDPSKAVLVSSRSTKHFEKHSKVVGENVDGQYREHLEITEVPMHYPCFDLDFPFGSIKVIESASGNSHLYINVPLAWSDVVKLLDVFQEVGLLEAGYVQACKEQGMTRLRMPGVPKLPAPWASSSV